MYNCENKIDVNIVVFVNQFGRLGKESDVLYSTWLYLWAGEHVTKEINNKDFPSLGHSLSPVQNLSRNHQHSLILSFV